MQIQSTIKRYTRKSAKTIDLPSDVRLSLFQKSETSHGKNITIFVHGLGGDRVETWAKFPEYLQEDLNGMDIGMYGYDTASKRFLQKTPNIEDQAKTLAHVIRSLSANYRGIFLVGHSMGGILCMGAVSYLLRTEKYVLDAVKSIFLIASPQLGSKKVPWFTRLISTDARALYIHNDYLYNIHESFANHINSFYGRKVIDQNSKPMISIPKFVVTADRDNWVDKLSSSAWIPSRQKIHVSGTHTSVVKPYSKESSAYTFVRDRIGAICQLSDNA